MTRLTELHFENPYSEGLFPTHLLVEGLSREMDVSKGGTFWTPGQQSCILCLV